MPHGPLHGIRVLDCSIIYAGPYAGFHLADMGADVVKVEHELCGPQRQARPDRGDVEVAAGGRWPRTDAGTAHR